MPVYKSSHTGIFNRASNFYVVLVMQCVGGGMVNERPGMSFLGDFLGNFLGGDGV